MNPDQWQRVKDLFGQACERAPEQRGSFLAEACLGDEDLRREVSSLLESHQETGSVFDAPVASAFATRVDPLVGRSIGAYRIIRQIGRGGMGSVYLAERSDDQFRRRVALKAVSSELMDKETLRRFHNERQTLAALDHPNIIKLLDGGTAEDGTPYLVMDYVEGQAIDEYCATHKLSTTERLQLFRTVCSAVTYAHQNLVVHRDLKPSNILITPDGAPKLLDFGIAKLLKAEYSTNVALTRTDLRPMTPEYASPEQVLGGPITTTSDIYSLGVLLYRLLTGFHPYQLKTHTALELERAICQTEPAKPSVSVMHGGENGAMTFEGRPENLARQLKGDLDMIVLMAMRKEPQRRYPSAEHLSEDLRRHLEGLPVTACKDSWRYRCRKFTARNKAPVAATAAIVVALFSSTFIAQRQAAVAEKRFQDLRQFANFALNDLDGAMRAGMTPARYTLVGKAMKYLDALAGETRNDPSIQRDLIHGYIKMGDIQGNLYEANVGEWSGAEQSDRKAVKIAEALVRSHPNDPDSRRELALANKKLADVLALTGNGKDALEGYDKARQIYEALLKEQPSSKEDLQSLMLVWDKIGSTQHQAMGDEVGALQSYRRCLDLAQNWFAVDPRARDFVTFASQQVALFRARTGDATGAEQTIREAIHTYESESPVTKRSAKAWRNIAKAFKNLATVQQITGQLPESLESVRQSLKISEEQLSKDPRQQQFQIDVHQARMLLIDILAQNGKPAEARAETVLALRFLKPLAEQKDASVYQIQGYAELLATTPFTDLQDNAAALSYGQKAVAMTRESDPTALDVLARAYARSSDFANALAVEQKAIGLLPPANPTRGVPALRKMLEANVASFRSGASQARR
jgi:non-specific serine/threonine protein kinase/serine/threonine-protein kinase